MILDPAVVYVDVSVSFSILLFLRVTAYDETIDGCNEQCSVVRERKKPCGYPVAFLLMTRPPLTFLAVSLNANSIHPHPQGEHPLGKNENPRRPLGLSRNGFAHLAGPHAVGVCYRNPWFPSVPVLRPASLELPPL